MHNIDVDKILQGEGLDNETIDEIKALGREYELQESDDFRSDVEMPWRNAASSSGKGAAFEKWVNESLMNGKMERLLVNKELNEVLNLEASHRRISDDYWIRENAIWDMKAGYERTYIDSNQLADYHKMLNNGKVVALKGRERQIQSVDSVNYLFDTKAGALRNQVLIADQGSERIFIWYLDANNQPALLDNSGNFPSGGK